MWQTELEQYKITVNNIKPLLVQFHSCERDAACYWTVCVAGCLSAVNPADFGMISIYVLKKSVMHF